MIRLLVALSAFLLLGCMEETTRDCHAAKHGDRTLMCCYTGMGAVGPQWRCAWVHSVPDA